MAVISSPSASAVVYMPTKKSSALISRRFVMTGAPRPSGAAGHVDMARHRANGQGVACAADAGHLLDAIEGYDLPGVGQAQPHRGQQALPPGHCPSPPPP